MASMAKAESISSLVLALYARISRPSARAAFAVTIPPGSFTVTAPETFSFFAVISGLSINAKIAHTDGQSYTFDATATANLSRTKSPTRVTLTIGNDTGTTTARSSGP
jgi:hypothetical protein